MGATLENIRLLVRSPGACGSLSSPHWIVFDFAEITQQTRVNWQVRVLGLRSGCKGGWDERERWLGVYALRRDHAANADIILATDGVAVLLVDVSDLVHLGPCCALQGSL